MGKYNIAEVIQDNSSLRSFYEDKYLKSLHIYCLFSYILPGPSPPEYDGLKWFLKCTY